jgi:hypothetical protein
MNTVLRIKAMSISSKGFILLGLMTIYSVNATPYFPTLQNMDGKNEAGDKECTPELSMKDYHQKSIPKNNDSIGNSLVKIPYYWAWWGWEPLEHNIRLGGSSYGVSGNALWVNEWYDRLHSRELVEKMKETGINLGVTHFFKGFGLNFEHEQQKRTAELVTRAHEKGIKILGYCQFRSLFYETFLEEEPEATNWIKRDIDGHLVTYGDNQYYRWSPCFHNPEFRSYLKRAIKVGIEETGVDGFNFDNCTGTPCYCDQCQKNFREWLSREYPQPHAIFGIHSFGHVRIPPTTSSSGLVSDPLTIAWIRWRSESLSEAVKDITDYARDLKPDVIVMANPAHPSGVGEPMKYGVWAPWVGRYLNLMITENANSPEIDGDLMISQVRAHKQAEAVGYKAVSTTWAEGTKVNKADASTRLPQTPTDVKLQVAEASANQGIPGTNWALRMSGGGNGMRIDLPDLHNALKDYLEFTRKNESLIFSSIPVYDIAVLHTFPSFAFNAQYAWDQTAGAEEILIRGGFSWNILFDEDLSSLNKYSVLILAGQTHLSDQTSAAISNFADKGGKVLLFGNNGIFDEDGRLPENDRFGKIPEDQIKQLNALEIKAITDRRWGVFAKLPSNWKQVSDLIEKTAGTQLTAHLTGGQTNVTMNAYKNQQEQLIVHLVNYGAPGKTNSMQLKLGCPWNKNLSARLICPGTEDRILQMKPLGANTVVDIPPLEVYGIIIVK